MNKNERIRLTEIAVELEVIQASALRFAELIEDQFMRELLHRDVIVGINAVIGMVVEMSR